MVPFTGKREDALVRHGRWRDEGRERLHEWEEGTGGLVKNYGPGRWLDLSKKSKANFSRLWLSTADGLFRQQE